MLSGRFTSHGGPRRTMVAGLSLGSAGLFALLVSGHGTPYWVLVPPMLAAGAGMALTMPAATTAVMEAAPADRGGAAAGLLNTARQVGSALGVAVAGSLLASRAGFLTGLHLALAVSGAAFLAGALVTLAWVDRRVDRGRAGVTGPRPAPAAGTRPAVSARRPG